MTKETLENCNYQDSSHFLPAAKPSRPRTVGVVGGVGRTRSRGARPEMNL